MTTFAGYAELPDNPRSRTEVSVRIEGDRLALLVGPTVVGEWSRTEIELSHRLDTFVLRAEGEELVITVDQPEAFWAAFSPPETRLAHTLESTNDSDGALRWWRFWDAAVWRRWWSMRAPWQAYRKDSRALDAEIADTRRRLHATEAELAQAHRDLRWATEVGPRPVPVRTAKTETGLASVSGITLLALRRHQGTETWRPVDAGAAHLTDRKLVFSGEKDIEFRFDKLTRVERQGRDLLLVVSSRKKPHLLRGDIDRLAAVLTAARAVASGHEATASFRGRVDQLTTTHTGLQSSLTRATASRRAVLAPPRPISPAWIPAAVLFLAVVVLGPPGDVDGAAAGGVPATTVAGPLPTTIPAPVSTTTPPPSATTPPVSAPPPTTAAAITSTTVKEPEDVTPTAVSGETTAYFFDVGQGDSTLLAGPDFTILVDAGRHDRPDVVGHLRDAGVEHLDLLVGTHPHADHIGQMDRVLAAFDVTEVWMSGDSHSTLTYERAVDAILDSEAGYHEPRAGETYTIGSAQIEVLNPVRLTGDLHEGSLALRVVFGEIAFLFTGDGEAQAEAAMIASGRDLRAQILQVGHHGSRTSTTAAFLEAVSPAVAVYSAGAGNQYGHPHAEVIDRLTARGIDVYGTDLDGTVVVVTDGTAWTVTGGATGPARSPSQTTTSTTLTTQPPQATASACGPGHVDINSAGFEDLQRIIEIGPDRAQQIIDLRPFSSVDSLTRVKGIAEARLKKIKDQGLACAGREES